MGEFEEKNNPVSDGLASMLDLINILPGIVFAGYPDRDHTLLQWRGNLPPVASFLEDSAVAAGVYKWAEIIHPSDREKLWQIISEAVATGRPYRAIYRLRVPVGSETWVLERGQLGKSGVLIGFITDHTDRMRMLSHQERQMAILEERHRLARDLHDTISQSLYSIALFAEAAHALIEQKRHISAQKSLEQVIETTLEAQRDIRLLIYNLRPSRITDLGLVPAIQERLASVEGRIGVHHEMEIGPLPFLTPEIEDAVYVIVHNALTNNLRHARSKRVKVSLHFDTHTGCLIGEVEDDGRGFDPVAAARGGGMGLRSMHERVKTLGGHLTIESEPGLGSTIRFTIPVSTHAGK